MLLDLDGTLVDSEPTHRAAFVTYFSRRGWDTDEELLGLFTGRRGAEVFAEVAGPWAGEDPVSLSRAVGACVDVETYPPTPVPGAAEAIRAWRAAQVPVSLVTSAGRQWAEAALTMLDVAHLGLAMVTAESVAAGKPAPEPYLRGAEALAADPARCVAFEDTPAGITAAREAGVRLVVGVRTSHADETLRDAGAHATVDDLRAVVGR